MPRPRAAQPLAPCAGYHLPLGLVERFFTRKHGLVWVFEGKINSDDHSGVANICMQLISIREK